MITRFQLRALGLVVLLVGLVSALLIYWSGADASKPPGNPEESDMGYENQDFNLSFADSKKATREMAIYYGQFGLVVEKWSRWLEELQQPRPMAAMIAAGSALFAAGCFAAARRRPPPV
jgi:hypothetical protein